MGSKLAPGLYFAGEVLDLDAYTGDLAKAALLWPGVTAQKQLYETQLVGTGYSIESLVQAYEAGRAQLADGAAQIAAAEQQLQDAQAQLVAGQEALDSLNIQGCGE